MSLEKLLAIAAIEVGTEIFAALAGSATDAAVSRRAAMAAERAVGQALARHRFDQKLAKSGKSSAT